MALHFDTFASIKKALAANASRLYIEVSELGTVTAYIEDTSTLMGRGSTIGEAMDELADMLSDHYRVPASRGES